MMSKNDIEYSAAALYDGGWRAADREELMVEYDLTEDEADELCKELADMEPKTWYAVQRTPEDEWGNGSEDKETALEMLKEQGEGLVAVIEGDTCMEELWYDDIFAERWQLVVTRHTYGQPGGQEVARQDWDEMDAPSWAMSWDEVPKAGTYLELQILDRNGLEMGIGGHAYILGKGHVVTSPAEALERYDVRLNVSAKEMGLVLRQAREAKGLLQADVSAAAGIAAATYRRLEVGIQDIRQSNVQTALRICKALGLDPFLLLN